ncbi:hypothetical protein [Rhodococcoides fascians]|uniref:hypothetical protein n=1 Tax=Rhodococcoides fascians TaxID=1828 RepID=UPI00050C31C9|nr:hypothetical protein [Rhodococcus fascians]
MKKRYNWGDTNEGDYTSVECDAGQFKPDVQVYHVDDNGDGLYMSWHAAVDLRDQLDKLLRHLEREGLS